MITSITEITLTNCGIGTVVSGVGLPEKSFDNEKKLGIIKVKR